MISIRIISNMSYKVGIGLHDKDDIIITGLTGVGSHLIPYLLLDFNMSLLEIMV